MTSTPLFTHRPVDPAGDLDLLHAWVTQERARFWGMTDHTRAEVGEVYAHLDTLTTHHAYLVLELRDARGSSSSRPFGPSTGSGIDSLPELVEGRARGGVGVESLPELVEGRAPAASEALGAAPVAIFQSYRPEHDPVGEVYDVQPGDLGIHLLVAPGEPRPGFTGALARYLLGEVFADPEVRRVVVEPDVLNERSQARVLREGFERGPVVDLGHKTAQLAFLPRPGG